MIKGKYFLIIVMITSLILITGCRSKERHTAKWNFLVYMAGDNNLEEYGIRDLNEMEMVGSSKNINILVLFDRHPQYDSSNGNWTGAKLFKVSPGSDLYLIESTVLKDYGEIDMSNPETLREFLVYCQKNFSAKKNILTLWNHGAGVYPRNMISSDNNFSLYNHNHNHNQPTTKGICEDESSPNPLKVLTTDEVKKALSMARLQTGVKIDIINMDACLMQMIEVAYEWRNEADYLVGSEENVPGDGNNYFSLLRRLANNPGMDPRKLAINLVEDYYQNYKTVDSTYSALRLGKELEEMVKVEFGEFVTALNNLTNEEIRDLNSIRDEITRFGEATNQLYDYSECCDLYDLADKIGWRLSTNLNMVKASESLMSAFYNVVISHKETGKFESNAHGLSILFPNDEKWTERYDNDDQYVTLEFAVDTGWDDFLMKLPVFK